MEFYVPDLTDKGFAACHSHMDGVVAIDLVWGEDMPAGVKPYKTSNPKHLCSFCKSPWGEHFSLFGGSGLGFTYFLCNKSVVLLRRDPVDGALAVLLEITPDMENVYTRPHTPTFDDSAFFEEV